MKIAAFAHGSLGDVWPVAALGHHLATRGHEVTVAAPGELQGLVEGAGLRAQRLPFDVAGWLSSPEGRRALHTGGMRVMHHGMREYARHADAFDEACLAAAEGAEAIVANFFAWDRALVLAEALQLPMAVVYQAPYARSREYSSIVISKGRLRSPRLRLASHDLSGWFFWRGSRATTNAFRRKLGMQPCSRSTHARLQAAGALGLHTFSPSVFPRPRDWADNLVVTGAWEMPAALREGLGGQEIPDELRDWAEEDEQRPIYFDFGSMPVLDPRRLLGDIAAATAVVGRRALVTEDCARGVGADELPAHVRTVGQVNHDRLFPHCAAVVHHGGIGSVTASLRAGRPTMVCSMTTDQPWWGEHMRRLGVGAHCRFRALDSATLESAMHTLLAPGVQARAQALGSEIRRGGDGLPPAVALLEGHLSEAPPMPVSGAGIRLAGWADHGGVASPADRGQGQRSTL